jgi:hypothetical protein
VVIEKYIFCAILKGIWNKKGSLVGFAQFHVLFLFRRIICSQPYEISTSIPAEHLTLEYLGSFLQL